jgi:metal-responsive CopG/Arc/MetJ family transcriptional regulator
MKEGKKMAKEKVQITMDSNLLRDVDDYCERNYLNRSWMISQACLQVVNQQKMVDAISNVSIALRNISDNGTVDDKTRKELETFETMCKMYLGK